MTRGNDTVHSSSGITARFRILKLLYVNAKMMDPFFFLSGTHLKLGKKYRIKKSEKEGYRWRQKFLMNFDIREREREVRSPFMFILD